MAQERNMQGFTVSLFVLFSAIVSSAETYTVACYLEAASVNRAGNGRFLVGSHIDPFLCTDIIFAHVNISTKSRSLLNINEGDSEIQRKLLHLKTQNPKVSIFVALGGDRVDSTAFERITADSADSIVFSNNAATELRREGFDGLEVAWTKQEPRHKEILLRFLRALRDGFEREARNSAKKKLLLTVAALPNGEGLYEPAELEHYVDRITVLAFNFNSNVTDRLMHHSPLYSYDQPWDTLSVSKAMAWWVKKCVPRDKLLLGLAAFGRTSNFVSSAGIRGKSKDKDSIQPGKTVTSQRPGDGGPLTKKSGVLAYYEICKISRDNNWKTAYDIHWKASYSFGNRNGHYEWVSHDDQRTIRIKCKFVKREGYGGVAIWFVDMDDFGGKFCRQGSNPLLREASRVLFVKKSSSVVPTEVYHELRTTVRYILVGFSTGLLGIIIGVLGRRRVERRQDSTERHYF